MDLMIAITYVFILPVYTLKQIRQHDYGCIGLEAAVTEVQFLYDL